MASLEITTADVLIALDVEGRGRARRAARETSLPRRILRTFVERGGPIPVDEIARGDSARATGRKTISGRGETRTLRWRGACR
jgi:hypothetical protein